jgi:formamidopyrimidine-DNA glycosylase
VPTAELRGWRPIADLGPEPTEITASELRDRLRGRSAPIKALLLDQRIVAGLGNIYVCEALHRARISPRRAAGRLSAAAVERLVEAVHRVIGEAIEAGGSTLRDFARPDGELGYFSKRFAVYDRERQPCHECGVPIRRVVQGARSTFYCAKCQR